MIGDNSIRCMEHVQEYMVTDDKNDVVETNDEGVKGNSKKNRKLKVCPE